MIKGQCKLVKGRLNLQSTSTTVWRVDTVITKANVHLVIDRIDINEVPWGYPTRFVQWGRESFVAICWGTHINKVSTTAEWLWVWFGITGWEIRWAPFSHITSVYCNLMHFLDPYLLATWSYNFMLIWALNGQWWPSELYCHLLIVYAQFKEPRMLPR